MKEVQLPCFNMSLRLDEAGGGVITSDLSKPEWAGRGHFRTFAIAVESLVLAHACAGIDVTTAAYLEGIETAIEHAANEYDVDPDLPQSIHQHDNVAELVEAARLAADDLDAVGMPDNVGATVKRLHAALAKVKP